MSMVVQHNMSAMNANRNLGVISGQLSKSTEKLSSGYRINRAGDDAAGLAISEKMRGQINGLNRASTNAQDGISLIQTAEGALTETHSILQRMRELAVQAASDTNTDDDRTQIQNEIDQLTNEIDRIAGTTEFNTMKLLDGSRAGSVSAKDGSASVEGTFTNSMVSAKITTDNSNVANFTEIARIEITKDFTEGMSTSGTPKYTATELDDAYALVSTDLATMEAEDAIENAIATQEGNVSAAQTAYDTAAANVETNKNALTTTLSTIANWTETDAADSTKKYSILAAGITVDDLSNAMNDLINAKYSGSDADVVEASDKLKALFSQDTSEVNTSSNTTTFTSAGAGTDVDIEDTSSDNPKDIGITLEGLLEDVADAIVADMNTADTAKATLADEQKTLDILNNTDLINAKIDYEMASADKAGAGTNTEQLAQAQARMDAAQAKIDSLNNAESVLTVTDLFGNTSDKNNFEISSKVADDNTLTVTLKNGVGKADTVITISNANQLKAGDVITITSNAMVESKAATTGEEALRLQIGANSGQEMSMSINSMKAKDLGIVQTKEGNEGKALDVTSQASASLAVNAFDLAIQKVSTERAKMGAVQNRLEHTIANLDTSAENLQAAESRIRDTDMAEEMTNYSKNNILQQAGQSMLAQANQSTQGVLSLLQ